MSLRLLYNFRHLSGDPHRLAGFVGPNRGLAATYTEPSCVSAEIPGPGSVAGHPCPSRVRGSLRVRRAPSAGAGSAGGSPIVHEGAAEDGIGDVADHLGDPGKRETAAAHAARSDRKRPYDCGRRIGERLVVAVLTTAPRTVMTRLPEVISTVRRGDRGGAKRRSPSSMRLFGRPAQWKQPPIGHE